jgi:hypothetical protein
MYQLIFSRSTPKTRSPKRRFSTFILPLRHPSASSFCLLLLLLALLALLVRPCGSSCLGGVGTVRQKLTGDGIVFLQARVALM